MVPASVLSVEADASPPVDPLAGAMQWREVGPYRAGRTTAVAGIPGNRTTFFMGTVGGGVWRTDDAGGNWRSVSDGWFSTASIGAIAISTSQPKRIYVGTGESPYRLYMSSHGDGVYRSDDGGDTWRNIGLRKSRQIGAIAIHPTNPDILLVAAQGDPWGGSSERGVYRSSDGGATWTHTLDAGSTAGARAVQFDPHDPRIAYATTWDHDYDPWYLRSGGPGSAVWKSMDGGSTWTRLGTGLPKTAGKIGLAVSSAKPGIVWVTVESTPEEAGLYLSENGGKSWRLVNRDRRLHTRAWYYMHVYADPKDPARVYAMANPPTISRDAGRTFADWQIHGWDFHALWLDPLNPTTLLVGSDGGATVSLDEGRTWSSLSNQPTAQLYRFTTDAAYPYTIYSAQQDNSTIAISSDRLADGPGTVGFHAVGGGESGFIGVHPTETRYIYASSELGTLTEYDQRTGATRVVSASLAFPEGTYPRDLKLRYAVNSPVVVSWADPGTVYHAAQRVMQTRDRGVTWEAISPDLTRNDRSRQGAGGGPFSGELINHYGAISFLAQSPRNAALLWTGSNDGIVHVSRDGKTWKDVTPPALKDGLIDMIDASPHAEGRATVAVNRMRFGDYRPYLYRTEDFGRTWRRIDKGLDEDLVVRSVREDPVRAGLLYLGTERGLYLSYDDGQVWHAAGGNLPITPITGIAVQSGDLVVSTQGRGIWSLDGIGPLQQVSRGKATTGLFRPHVGILGFGSAGDLSAMSTLVMRSDRPQGTMIDFMLTRPDAGLVIRILSTDGKVLRTLNASPERPAKVGLNRWHFDLRRDPLMVLPGAFDGQFDGARLSPGTYKVELVSNGETFSELLEIAVDPRIGISAAQFAEQQVLLADLEKLLAEIAPKVAAVREAAAKDARLADPAKRWEAKIHAPQLEISQDRVNYGGRFLFDLFILHMAISSGPPPFGTNYARRLSEVRETWEQLKAEAPKG